MPSRSTDTRCPIPEPSTSEAARAALQGARPEPFWLDSAQRPAPRNRLVGEHRTQLAVVGGGFCGLWTAVLAKERDPLRDVLLVEADRVAGAATGRNGGFCEASLTHGESNGRSRFAGEYDRIAALGRENLTQIAETIARYGIDCGFERTGTLQVATEPHQLEDLEQVPGATALDAEEMRAELDSPTYVGGVFTPGDCAILDPARLAWGLARVAEQLGVRIAEHTPVLDLARTDGGVELTLPDGRIHAEQVSIATNAFRPLLRRLRWYTVPVYDYVLVTEPLTEAQLASIGWRNRQGVSDSANQFHYYRLTEDNRILWGGYDAVYHFGRRLDPSLDQRPETFDLLARHFFETFPQLAGVRFTHRWGGAIDTCTRFFAFFGRAHGGRVAYALGFTGLGVGATRFAAEVMLDLLSGRSTELTRLKMVRRRPLPFPPEPFAYLGIQITRWSLARADARGGRRNLWLRALDRAGVGFDS